MVACMKIFFVVAFFYIPIPKTLALKNVALKIDPKVVPLAQNSTLYCFYELEPNDILYTVKWYRGSYEFYRFTPSQYPGKKMFPKEGITIDINSSNGTQVKLTNIEFRIAGNFTCEVTIEAPFFSTRLAADSMSVVMLPEYPPKISVGTEPLDYGDELRANCSTPPSRPSTVLQFILNNITVAKTAISDPKRNLKPTWSDLTLRLNLSEHHFDRGRLILRCIAHIPEVYYEEAILELDSAREPIPERVSAFDSASAIFVSSKIVILASILFATIS